MEPWRTRGDDWVEGFRELKVNPLGGPQRMCSLKLSLRRMLRRMRAGA